MGFCIIPQPTPKRLRDPDVSLSFSQPFSWAYRLLFHIQAAAVNPSTPKPRAPATLPPPGVLGLLPPPAPMDGVPALVGAPLLLCSMCAFTKCPAANAAPRLSSPASTPAATTRASCLALVPGDVGCAPRTPRRSSSADCACKNVPPPIVPTSMLGRVTLILRLPPWLENVRQLIRPLVP